MADDDERFRELVHEKVAARRKRQAIVLIAVAIAGCVLWLALTR